MQQLNSFATVIKALTSNNYVVQLPNGLNTEATYYAGTSKFSSGDRVFMEYAPTSQLWMIACLVIAAPTPVSGPQSYTVSLTATLTVTGSFARNCIMTILANLSFSSTVTLPKTVSLSGSLSFAGGLTKTVGRKLIASLITEGLVLLPNVTYINLTAALGFASSIVHSISLRLKGQLGP